MQELIYGVYNMIGVENNIYLDALVDMFTIFFSLLVLFPFVMYVTSLNEHSQQKMMKVIAYIEQKCNVPLAIITAITLIVLTMIYLQYKAITVGMTGLESGQITMVRNIHIIGAGTAMVCMGVSFVEMYIYGTTGKNLTSNM